MCKQHGLPLTPADQATTEDLRPTAGHAAHFLTRLDRVSSSEVELALALYNDVPLLTEILRRARIPERATRIAIALAHGGRGPHIVVTRDAKFVTCLGAGMSPTGLHVIARGQLDAFAEQVEGLRSKLRACLAMSRSGDGAAVRVLGRVFEAGPALSREEFIAASQWMPLVLHSVVPLLGRMLVRHESLRFAVRKQERFTPRNRKLLLAYWQNVWAMGHLVALATEDARTVSEAYVALGTDAAEALAGVLANVAKTGVIGLMIRVIGFVARAGKALSPTFKRLMLQAMNTDELLLSFAVLGGIAHRHARLAPEVRKAFGSPASSRPNAKRMPPEKLPRVDHDIDTFRHHLDGVLDAPDASTRRIETHGAHMALAIGRRLGAHAGPFAFAALEEVPASVSRALVASWFRNAIGAPRDVLDAVPWAASCEPAELYLPAAYARLSSPLTGPQVVVQLLGESRLLRPSRKPDVRGTRVGRNRACACASGRKSKRCCGA